MRIFILMLITMLLSGCGHSPLKAPCGPSAAIGPHPCSPMPINIAMRGNNDPYRS